jgi:hypothetical protein
LRADEGLCALFFDTLTSDVSLPRSWKVKEQTNMVNAS